MDNLIRTGNAAYILKVSQTTVTDWGRRGWLKSVIVDGFRYWNKDEVEALAKKREEERAGVGI